MMPREQKAGNQKTKKMIDARHLRIGNLVYGYGLEVIFRISSDHIVAIDRGDDSYSPIELTDEVLDGLGYEKDGFHSYNLDVSVFPDQYKKLCFSGDYLFLREEGVSKQRREQDSICVLWNMDVMGKFYLHQFQNLYQSLTSKELDVSKLISPTVNK